MALDQAFVELLQKRNYDAIRVADIARKSGVGRATFYAHYPSKDDLLRAQLERMLPALLTPTRGDRCLVDATALFRHIEEVPAIHRLVMSSGGRRIVEQGVEGYVLALLSSNGGQSGDRGTATNLTARFVAASLLGLIAWWVENAFPLSATQLQSAFRSLAGGTVGPPGVPL